MTDVDFRRDLDERLKAAFGEPPDFAKMVEAPTNTRRLWFAAVAALLLVAVWLAATWKGDAQEIDAEVLWAELRPVVNCSAPVMNSKQLAQHCTTAHDVGLQILLVGNVYVHGPTKSVTFPDASVLTIVLPPTFPGAKSETRVVLIGGELPIRATDSVRVFRRTVRGLHLVEMAKAGDEAEGARALAMFR